jgi:hypothetical protein
MPVLFFVETAGVRSLPLRRRERVDGQADAGIVIVGAGPTGLMLGGRAGVGAASTSSSSSGAPARTSSARARAACTPHHRGVSTSAASPIGSSRGTGGAGRGFRLDPLDISDFPTRHPYGLGLWQKHIERILAGWVGELGCRSIADAR